MSTSLFVSDIHLDAANPAVVDFFLDFLSARAPQADALYILGDFFEIWIGDDDLSALSRAVIEQLHALSAQGTAVHVMTGNRDFLLGERFAEMSGCRLLPDPTVAEICGTPVLLMHGDTLCTDDTEYQRFRATVRTETWIASFLARPLEARAQFARDLRSASRRKSSAKSEAIMDVNQEAVREALRSHGVRDLIHGHTHRPAIHTLELDGGPARRMVLGDWQAQARILVWDERGPRLETLVAEPYPARAASRGGD